MSRLVAGFGCQGGCPVEALDTLLQRTLNDNGLSRDQLTGIASLDRKADEPGLLQLAGQLGVPLHTFSTAELAAFEASLSHRSALSFAHTGCHGVAESAALALAAAAGETPRLLIPRQQSHLATLAIACSEGAYPRK